MTDERITRRFTSGPVVTLGLVQGGYLKKLGNNLPRVCEGCVWMSTDSGQHPDERKGWILRTEIRTFGDTEFSFALLGHVRSAML
jgi:hypothetical protein